MPEHNAAPPGDGMLTRAESKLSSFNPEARTFDVVLATETAVRRRGWDIGPYDEILVVNRSSIDTSRLESMALVDSHDTYGLDSRIGSVLPGSLRFEGNTAIVTAKLSRNPKGEAVFRDLEDGHTLSASVGYRILAQTKTEAPPGGAATIRATKWLPMELSIVSVGADPNASTRSQEQDTFMPDTITAPAATQTRAERNTQIRTVAKTLGLAQHWIDEQIDSERSIDEINTAALAAVQARTAAAGAVQSAQIGTDHTDPAAIRSAMADALAHRIAPGAVKLEGRAVEYRGHRLLDMVADMAVARGERVNLRDTGDLLERAVGAHSTSDLPLILSAASNKSLLAQYSLAQPTYRQWSARKPFVDFKDHQFMRLGDFPAFTKIVEGGSVVYGTTSENAEKVKAEEYTAGIAIGRRALLADDLSALSDFSSTMAMRAANDENRMAYAKLAANGQLSDSTAIFHADHANLAASGGAIDETTLGAAVKALRAQTSLDGMTLNLRPALLVVGPAYEVAARKILSTVAATKVSDLNVWANLCELVVDANIAGNAWYLFASPAEAPVFIYGYVAGSEGPVARSERDFDTQAIKIAATLDWACDAIDYRGAYKNSGA